jgi:glucose/arabinose dehydrogenase
MTKILTSLLLAILFSVSAYAQPSTVTVGGTTLDVRVVIQGNNPSNGVDIPWEIQWGPDGFIWMTERYGRVSRLDPETGARTTILDLTNDVYDQSEAGLLGLVLHPDFENNPYVYLAYTYSPSFLVEKERIVRYTYNEGSGTLGSPLILLDDIEANSTHNGCRLLILDDNTLLATTGDYQNTSSPQNNNLLNGKILRMNLDGTIPSDNPFGSNSYVYSKGHRNAQGLIQAPNGKIYSSEHGPSTNDELNIIISGKNYGWPEVAGFCNTSSEMSWCNSQADYEDPIAIWYESSTIAVSDIAWYDHPAIPEWQGKILMTVLKTEHLKSIELNAEGTAVVGEEIHFNSGHANNPNSTSSSTYNNGDFNRLRDVLVAPDGRVFLATSGPSWGTSGTFQNSIVELKNSAYSPTGINDFQTVNTKIYPNPAASGLVTMEFDNELLGAGFDVFDNVGRPVFSGRIDASKMQVDLSGLASGLYMVRSAKGQYTTIERLVITE